MGGLNSGPGPGITLLIAFVLILCSNVLSAPLYEEDDTQDSNAQGVIEPQGCYYNFQHYNEGERILTNEPCLNCTCRNRMLMCYLRVCPFTKGIGQNCTVEKVPGQCCPIITCPEVPVQLLTSSTTEHSEGDGKRPDLHHGIKGTAVGHLDNNGCQIDGVFYPNGAQVPGNPEKPCELCYCIRNKTACIMQSCALHVDGCRPIYEDGQCFPVRYQCDDQPYVEEQTTTIRPAPTPGLIITTTSSEPLECFYNNEIYEDGSRIQTEDPCEHCYCLKGKIACAVQECGAPLEKEGQNCTALPPAPGKCCPDSYQCDITMSSQKFGQGSEGTTEAGFSSVADAGHPTDGHYPGEHGATKTTEKPKYGTNQLNEQSGQVTEGLTLEAVTPSKEVSGKPSVTSDGQGPHFDKGQPGTQDSSGLEHDKELDKGTQLPTKHQDSLPNNYEGMPDDVSNVSGEQKVTSADETKPGVTKRPSQGFGSPTIPGSLDELVQRQNQSQTDPHSQKPEQLGDEKGSTFGSKPHEPSSLDTTKVQDGIQTTHGYGHPTTESEHILHVMEQQKPAPGIESHIQDTSSTKRPLNEGLSNLNDDSTEKTASTKPSYGDQWKPQPGIYQPNLQGTPFDVSQGQMSPDRTKPVFPGSNKLPEDTYDYSTPISAIDEDQNVKNQMTVSNTKDQLIDKLHNIIQDVQAQVNDGKTTEMPEEADYKTTTQSQKGHFTEKPDTIHHLHHGSQDSPYPIGSGQNIPTTKPTGDKETQQGNAVTDTPKDTNDIFNKIQGIIHGMFTQVTEAVQTTLAPLTTGDVDGKKPSKVDEESTDPEHKPDTTHQVKPSDGSSKPTDTHDYFDKVGLTGAPDNLDKHPHGSVSHYPHGSTKYPDYTGSPTRKPSPTQTRYPDGSKPEDSEYPSITHYPDYISPDGETDNYGKYPEGTKPFGKYPEDHEHKTKPVDKLHGTKPTGSDNYPFGTEYPEGVGVTSRPQDTNLYPLGTKPSSSQKYPHGTEYPNEVGSTVTPDEYGKYPDESSPVKGSEGVKYPTQTGSTGKPHYSTKYPGSKYPEGVTGKPTGSEDEPYGTKYPEGEGFGSTGRPEDHGKYPEGTKPSGQKYPQYPHGTKYPHESEKYPDETSPVKGSEGVKYPGQTESTGKPHYSTKYPGDKYPEGVTGKPDRPYNTEYPEEFGSTGRPQDHGKYPEGTKPSGQKYPHYPHGTEYPDEVGSTVTPDEFGKYPDGASPVKGIEGVKDPSQIGSTSRPYYSTKYPGSKYPEGVTGKPTGSEDEPYGTEYPESEGFGSTGRPQDHGKYPEGTKPSGQKYPQYPHGTEYPDEMGSTVTPDEFGKYPDGTSPVKESEGVKYPGQTESTGKPHYSTKYPEGVTGKPIGSENQPYGTEYPEGEGFGSSGRPQDHGKYPEGTKPSGQKYPQYPHGNEYPDESEKYPDGTSPVKGPEGVKYPTQTGSTGKPHYSTKYPGSKYPENLTGKPIGSDGPYGTNQPEGTKPVRVPDGVIYPSQSGSTSRPQIEDQYLEGTRPSQSEDHPLGTEYTDKESGTERPYDANKYPGGFKPSEKYPGGSQPLGTKLPEFSTLYPNEYDSTVTPDVSGKHPEDFDPAQKPQDPAQNFGRPTGKPYGTEEYPYGTDHPEGQILTGKPGIGSTSRPDDSSKYPYPTDYPGGFTGKPDDLSKFPDGSRPVRPGYKPHDSKYPTGSPLDFTRFPVGSRPTFRPIESGKYPVSSTQTSAQENLHGTERPYGGGTTLKPQTAGKYPDAGDSEKVTSKYPEGLTDKPYDLSKYPQGSKPSDKYPFGTEYPEGMVSTVRPNESGKYPDETSPVKGEEDMTLPDQTGSTGRPHYSNKYPGSKYPEGFTGKPIDSEDQPYGTEYPDGVGVTGRPQDVGKHPEGTKPSHPDSELPHGTEYPEGGIETDRPYDSSKYPDKTKPIYPSQTGSTGRPHYSSKYPGSKIPEEVTDTEQEPHATKSPEDVGVTGRPEDSENYPEKLKPAEKPDDLSKYPGGVKPANSNQLPGGEEPSKRPEDEETGTGRPYDPSKYPDGYRPNHKYPESLKPTVSQGSTKVPHDSDDGASLQSGADHDVGSTDKISTDRPDAIKHPEGYRPTDDTGHGDKHPQGSKPTTFGNYPFTTKYPDEAVSTSKPIEFGKHPEQHKTDEKHGESSKTPEGMKPEDVKYPHGVDRPNEEAETDDHVKYPEGTKPSGQKYPHYPHGTEYPDEVGSTVTPDEFGKYPDGASPVKGIEGVKDPSQIGSTSRPYYSTKYPGSKYPEGVTGKPTGSEDEPYGTEYPESEGFGSTGRPQDHGKYPEGTKPSGQKYPHYPHGTEHPDEVGSTVTPDEFGKYPDGSSPVKGPEEVKYPGQTESTGKPQHSTKYPGSKYPEGVTGKPDQPYSTEYSEGFGFTGRPENHGKYPEDTKPSGQKYPQYPHGTGYPDEVGTTVTPDEFGKYPDGSSPVKGSEGVKYPTQTGSTGKPYYSTKYPEGVTGKPDQPYGTEYPEGEGFGSTGRPEDHVKYPEGTKPSGQKYPHYPHGTEYPDEIGSTVTPDEFGKYPDGSSPVKGPEGVKYPGQTESTGKPHYSTKYPGDKYPEGVTGKPTGSEDEPYSTEYPEGFGSTGRPEDHGKYPEGTKPSSQKYPQYPHGTEYPDEMGSTVTSDEFGKYPDGSSPVKGSGEVKYPTQIGSTGKPYYSTKYPGSKHPEGVTGKPDQPYGTEYPDGEGFVSTGRPQDLGKYPEGTKPSSQKYPQYPHGTGYPDEVGTTVTPGEYGKYPEGFTGKPDQPYGTEYPEVGSTVTADDYGKYPDGTSPVKGSEGVKYPGQTESTGKPPHSTKYPGSKYPEGVTGKPTGSEDQPLGTKYPEDGVTDKTHGSTKYPDGMELTHSESDDSYGTEHPEGETGTDKPYDSSKYPEGTKPVRGPDGVIYSSQSGSTGRPLYSTHSPDGEKPTFEPEGANKLTESLKPEDADENLYSTSKPHKTGVYHRPQAGSEPHDKYPVESQTGSDHETLTTEFPENVKGTSKPYDLSKHPEESQPSATESTKVGGKPKDPSQRPEGTQPEDVEHYPHGTEYPDQVGSTGKPYDSSEHPEEFDTTGKFPEKSTPHGIKYPEGETGTVGPFDFTKHPDGSRPSHSTKYPGEFKPTMAPQDLNKESDGTKYPEYTGTTLLPHVTSKYPGDKMTSGKPEDSNKMPEEMEPSGKRPGTGNEQFSNEYPNEILGTDKPYDSTEHPDGFKPHYSTKHPAGIIPSDLESMSHSTKYPHHPAAKPDEFGKHPDGKEPVNEPGSTSPDQATSSGTPHYSTKYPESHKPDGRPQNLLPVGFTDTPSSSEDQPHGTAPTDEVGVTDGPHNLGKFPEESKPTTSQKHPHDTEHPDEFGKYPDGSSPVKGPEGVKYPGHTGSTAKPHYSTKYPGSKYPEGVTGKPDQPYGTEYPESTDRPQDHGKYPEGTKPSGQKYPQYPHGTGYPDEVGTTVTPGEYGKYPEGFTGKPDQPYGTEYPEIGSTVTPDEFGKYPDGASPVKGIEGVKDPSQIGSTSRPYYSTKHPGSKYPEGVTGKPTGSEDEPYGTEYPESEGFGSTGRPQDHGKYPEGTKPSGQKYPHYPHGTEYPDEVGSSVTPDEIGKYPDGSSPVKGPEGVKYPGQTESTGKPHYSTKYPGGKYPDGVTGKPDQPYGTEYPEGETGTDRPYDSSKYPDGIKPVREPEGVLHPGQASSTERPHYTDQFEVDRTKPHDFGSYPEGVKPTDKHPDYNRVTDIPFDVNKFPDETKPVDSEESKSSTKRPDGTLGTTKSHDSSKYPGGVHPSTSGYDLIEGQHPGFTKVTEKPYYSTKYPEGEKPSYPEYAVPGEQTDRPHDTDKHSETLKPSEAGKYPDTSNYPSGTEDTNEAGSTIQPESDGKHPTTFKPTGSGRPSDDTQFSQPEGATDSNDRDAVTKHPEGADFIVKPVGSSQLPEGEKPSLLEKEPEKFGGSKITIRPDGVTEYPEEHTGEPHYTDKYPQEIRPTIPDGTSYSTEYPEGVGSDKYADKLRPTGRPHGSTVYPEGSTTSVLDSHGTKPEKLDEYPEKTGPSAEPHDSEKYPESGKPISTDKYPQSTEYSNEVGSTVTPEEYGKYPHGSSPVKGSEGVKYPTQTGSTGKPHYSTKYPGSKYPEGVTGKPTGSEDEPYGTEYPEGEGFGSTGRPEDHGKYPEGTKPSGQKYPHYPHGTEYPDEVGSTVSPDEFGKYPDGSSPVKGSEGVKYPSQIGSTGKPHYSTKYPEGVTGSTGSEEQPYGTEYPEGFGSTGRPEDHGKYPEDTKPSGQKYPHYPHGTEYPDEVGSSVTPDEIGKYPDGSSPVKGSEGVKYPSQTGSTGKPHYSTKYPGSKYPEGVTGSTEEQPYGTEYPEGFGSTGKPQDFSKYPDGAKPIHGTEYPGVTGKPQVSEKYPQGVKPTYSDSERPYGTDYPEGEFGTERPYDSSKYPEGTKPVRGPDVVVHPGQTGSTDIPQGVGKFPEEGKPIFEDKYPVEGKPTTPKDSSLGTQYPSVLGGSVSDSLSSSTEPSGHESVSKQPGSAYLPQHPETGKPISPADDKDKPLELPEESYSGVPEHDRLGSSTSKDSESDGQTDKPGVPISDHSIDEMDVTTHTPGEHPKRPDSADLTHDSKYTPQLGEHSSSVTSSTESPDGYLNSQYPATKKPSTDQDEKVAPQGTKAPQDNLPAAKPDFEGPHTEKTSYGDSTPKLGSSETERPVPGLSGHDQSTTDQYGSIKHPGDERVSTSPGSVNNYSESSDEYSTTEYSNQDGITGKPSGTHTKRPVEHPSRPGEGGIYTTKQPSEGRPTHPESVSAGSEGVDSSEHTPSVYETTTLDNDDLINKLQSIISGIQTQVTHDKTTRQPSTSDSYAPFGHSTEKPQEGVFDDRRTTPSSHRHPSPSNELGEQQPQDHSEQPSTEYATDKPYLTGDKRRPIDVLDSTKPHSTDKPLVSSADELTTQLGEETTGGYLEEENEIHDPEGHTGKKPQSTKKPSSGLSTEFPETGRPDSVTESSSRPSDETAGSHSTKYPEEYTDHPAGKPHDTYVQTHDKDKPTSLTDKYPEEGKKPDKVPASGEKVTGKPDDSIHFPDEEPGRPTFESSTTVVSDEHTPTHKTGSTQVGSDEISSTTSYDSEKPEGFDSSTKRPGTHYNTLPGISQTEIGDSVHETSSTPVDGDLGVTNTPETSVEPQKGFTKPGDKPVRPDGATHSHGEENVPIYHGIESMTGKPTDQPDSMIGEDHTLLSEEDSAGTKKPLKPTEKPSQIVPVDEETAPVTESETTVDTQDHKHPTHQEPTDKPLHVVYPTYYPDGIITRKPGSKPQDLGNKVTVTPQSNVYGTSTPSKEGDDTTQSFGDREVTKPTSKVPIDGSSVSSGEPVTEGLDTEGSTKRVVPQEGFTTEDKHGEPHSPVDKHPDSSVDDTQGSGESGTSSPVIIIEEVHTEVHSERATTKPGTESYDQTTKFVTSVYPHGSDESQTKKPEIFDGKTTKNPDLFSQRPDSVFQEGKPGYGSTAHPLSTDRPQDSLHHSPKPDHDSSVPVSGTTESHPDVLIGSTTDESLLQGTGKPDYQTKHPETLDGKFTNEPGLVTDGTTPPSAQSGQPGSEHIMNLYSPKDKYSTTINPELVKGTQQPESFTTGSRVPGVTEDGSLYSTSKPDDSHQGPTFDHEIFGSKFPGRKTTQKPIVTPEARPDFTTVFGVGTTNAPQEGVTSTPGMNVEHHVPSYIFPQKPSEQGVTSTEGYITQGKPLTTVGQSGVVFEGKPTTPSYQFITSGTRDPEISTKKPFQPVKGASYVPYKIIDGRKVYYPEREVPHKPDESDKHGFDGFDYLPYEIVNGKKFFKPNEVVSQPAPTSTTPKHRLGMYVPYKIINGTKVYYTEDPQGKPHAGVGDYDGLDYVPFDIINGTKVFYPEDVNEPTSPTSHETTTTPSYIMAMYVPYKIINGTKVYYPEDSPNKPENEDYDGLDYVPFEIINGNKVFYPERVSTPPKGTSTPSYVMAMYVPYKIINGTKVYYPEDPQGKPQSEDYDGLDYVPFEIVNGTKVFYPERVTATPEATTKPAHIMAMYVPYKIINGTKVYYPEEPQVGSEEYDGLDYVPFKIVNGTKVFYPERASTTSSYESTTTPSYPSAMYVPYKIVNGRKVYYPKYAQYKPYKVPEGFVGFDYIPYEIVNGSKVFYPDRVTTVRPAVSPMKHHQGMYVPYKIVNGTKIYYPKDAEEKPQGVLDGYDGSDYVPYEIVNGTQVFYPEKATTEKPGIKAMYVPYKIVDGTKFYYAKDAQPTPNLIPKGYDGFDFVPYEIVNGTKTFYPERVTTPAPNEFIDYTQGMYVPYKIVDGRKVYYPQRAQHNPLHIPEGYEGFDYILYDIVNGTKVFHPERVTASPVPTHAPSGTFYPQGMYVPFRVINGTKVFYPQDAQQRPDPMKNDYDGWQHLPYDIVNGTKVFYPERVTTEAPVGQMSAMYIPFKMINGTKVFYANDAQYQPYLIPEGYDGFDYVPYEIVNGTKMFYPDRATSPPSYFTTTAKPIKQGMFVPYKIINGAKVYYPKHASISPRPPSSEYNGVDFIPYEVINGTKVFYPDRIQGPQLETSGTQAMYVPYKLVNGTKVFYPKDAQFKPYLIPEGYDGFDYLPYEVKNGTKVFYPETLTVTQRPEKVPSQGMFVPYKMINGQKVYYPKEAQKRPHPLSNEYDGLDYIPYEVVNGTKVFYPEYVTQSADMSGTPLSQAMYVPYKIINGTKVFYPKYAQAKPHLVPDGYDGFEYIPYKIVNGTKFFYPDRVSTQPPKVQGMYVPYKIINGTKVFYPKYAQPTLQQLPKGFDGIDYIPYEIVNGTKVFYPEKATPSGVSGTPVVQALYVPYKIINGKKVFYPKYAVERPQTVPEGYDGFAYMPYSIVNGTKMFYPEQAQFPGLSQVPSLEGTFVPYKLLNSTKVFYPKYANDETPQVPDGYDGVDYVPYEPVNGTKVFYPELISPQASSGTSPVPGKYVPYKVVNGKKVFYPKEGKPEYPSGGVRYPYDGIVYVPYKSLTGASPSRPENYPPFVAPEHSLYGQNSEIVYVDDDDESFRPQFISQSRPSQEQSSGHIGHVPGEGSCFLNNKTYENNMEIPPVSPCQSRCRCINSIVRCVRIKCPPLPQTNTASCSPVYDEGSCCPTYSCENDDLDYLTTTEYPGSQDSSEYPEMVLTGSTANVISFGQGFDSTTQFAVTDASPHKPHYGQEGAGDLSGGKPYPSRKPVTSDGQHPTDQYHIHRPQKPKPSEQGSLEPYDGVEGHPMPGEFSSEDDYDGDDEEPYGPGTCRYAGKVYVSAQQIPRDDPCDFCFCFRSDIICLQQSCPPPIPGCRDEPIQGFCCPRYECHVKMATLLNVTSTTTTTTTTLPPHFFLHPYKGSATRTGCFVQGKAYRVGQAIPSASGPCMDCICRGNGRMECEPKVCTPEPMIRKMIVPADNTTSPSSER